MLIKNFVEPGHACYKTEGGAVIMIPGFLWVTQPEEFEQCRFVRTQVFIEEQGFSNEFDEMDQTAHHLLFLDDEKPVATARLFLYQGEWHAGRVCVLKSYRGRGIGAFLMKECIKKASELGQSQVLSISAQLQARPFYEKLGFRSQGEPYLDEHCPHIKLSYHIQEELT